MDDLWGTSVENPEWEKSRRVHDWRNYIDEEVKAIWNTFTPEQRMALAKQADNLASAEEWD